MKLYHFQEQGLEETKGLNRVAYYWDMGTGKTFVGAEKLFQLGAKVNLVVCQKSKVEDWFNHFSKYPKDDFEFIIDGTQPASLGFFVEQDYKSAVCIINYDLIFRRPELTKLKDFTLLLDESSIIQNENSKRSKFILKKLKPANVILLSGTPTGGKYENLWSQLHLLGWKISKDMYWNQYVDYEYTDKEGFPIKIVKGYKNVERLKEKMRQYGCRFLKTEEVFELPEQIFEEITVNPTKSYRLFRKNSIIKVDGVELVGDTTLTKMLYERMLCGQYNGEKISALKDLLSSTDDRVIIFYNFNEELRAIEDACIELDKPMSIVNGKTKDLILYDEYPNSVTAVQYQAGSMGLNLQKANKIIYFTPPLSSELFEQSKKRIHRIGQTSTCFYYMLVCRNSIERSIYNTLAMRKDYTDELFREQELK